MGNVKAALRYARAPSKDFIRALQGSLAFLLHPELLAGKHLLDLQFREDDRLMLYTGSTCVLSVKYSPGGRLTFAAADRYKSQHMRAANGHLLFAGKDASEEQRRRVHKFTASSGDLEVAITGYLASVDVSDSWLRKESEVQMRARLVRGGQAWWHLDREGVLGGGSEASQAGKHVEAAWRDLLATPAFARRQPTKTWALQRAKDQDELDQIGVDGEGRLVLAELKYGGLGSVATFIYAAPMQLLRYAWAWDTALEHQGTRDDVQHLLDAKRALFPKFYEDAPARISGGLRAVVAFGDALRLDTEVQDKLWAAVACAERHLPGRVQPQRIEVWNIDAEGVAAEVPRFDQV